MGLVKEIRRYSKLNGYEISRSYPIICDCGKNEFRLYSDDDEGGAYCWCANCKDEISIENSRQYMRKKVQLICSCEYPILALEVGIANYEGTDDPLWVYVGGSCLKCAANGVYVHWHER